MSDKKPGEGLWFKAFCPEARCLSEEEVASLPPDVREAQEASGKDGLWLEFFCPDQSCLSEEEKSAPVPSVEKKNGNVWLKLFCPEGSCKISGPGDLP